MGESGDQRLVVKQRLGERSKQGAEAGWGGEGRGAEVEEKMEAWGCRGGRQGVEVN